MKGLTIFLRLIGVLVALLVVLSACMTNEERLAQVFYDVKGNPITRVNLSVQRFEDGRFFALSFKRKDVDSLSHDRKVAVVIYMSGKQLIPPECINGVTVISSGDAENGWGHAKFVCAK